MFTDTESGKRFIPNTWKMFAYAESGKMFIPNTWKMYTTESITSASFLELLLSIGRNGQLHTSIYDKRDDYNFHMTNFPFLISNIPFSPAYGVLIS